MRNLLTALYRHLHRSRPSTNGAFHVDDPANEEEAGGSLTLGHIPPEGTRVEHLTFSSELVNDAARFEMFCRLCRIRFASEPESSNEGWCYTI